VVKISTVNHHRVTDNVARRSENPIKADHDHVHVHEHVHGYADENTQSLTIRLAVVVDVDVLVNVNVVGRSVQNFVESARFQRIVIQQIVI
jgi:hypothetical protein